MMSIRYLLYYLILNALLQNGYTKKKSKVCILETVQRDFNKNYLSSYSISIQPDKITLDLEVQMLNELKSDVWCLMSVKKCDQKYTNCYDLLGYNVNVCSLLGKDNDKTNILHYFLKMAFKNASFPSECPVAKGTYSWHNLKLLPGNIPPYLLKGLYSTNILFYKRKRGLNVTICNTTVGARLR